MMNCRRNQKNKGSKPLILWFFLFPSKPHSATFVMQQEQRDYRLPLLFLDLISENPLRPSTHPLSSSVDPISPP